MGATLLWLCALTAVSWEVVSSQDSVCRPIDILAPAKAMRDFHYWCWSANRFDHGGPVSVWTVRISCAPRFQISGKLFVIDHNVALGARATSTVITDGDKDTCLPMNWKTTDILQVDLVNSTAVHAVSIVWNINNFFYITPVASIHVGDSLGQQGSNNSKCQDIKMDQGSSMSTYNCGGINGRYVTLNLDSIATSYICEIMVSATPLKEGTQVLMYGVASQSSKVAPGAGPWKALDSRVDNDSPSTLCMTSTAVTTGHGCSITDMDWEPWWRLDMMLLYRVKSVTIAGRGDINGLRLFGAEIRVGNSMTREDNGICDQDIFVTSGQSMEFHCPPWLVGRFLTVALPGRVDSLGLCEVSLLANPMLKSSILWKNGIISTSDSTTPN